MAIIRFVAQWSAIVAVIGMALIAVAWAISRPADPGPFYQASPQRPGEPGALLRSESFTKDLPAAARGWRILYTTTRANNSPAVASAVVVASTQASTAPRPVIAWAHGTTGIAPGCAPSVMAPFANVPAIDRLIGENWIYVATDYVGLGTPDGHAYLVGEDAARAVLDAIRAARKLEGLSLDNRAVVWGHSQGGNSALWTGVRADDYAPDVNIVGIAALAPASDLPALFKSGQGTMFGKIVSSYLIEAYAAAYPDVSISAYVQARTRPFVGDIASRCVGGRSTLFSVAESKLLPSAGIFARDPASGPLGERLRQNTPATAIPAPVLIAQGSDDDLVLPRLQFRYVAARCAAGQPIDYRIYPGRDHVSLVAGHAALDTDLVAWSRDRFAGLPDTPNCRR
ncbi:lipase family protein [Bradyrhizobium sp.]|uniref:lipase family protein n=1 Tax=Bradyrhizobium sp. TaxID=376 RepID=UPI001D62EA33|nr:lipase family protein [Bradyrhizobium sp.]MBI5321990.1 alpha/beta fold hydrolase [Bradyrhizobium sp.]